MCRIHLLYIYRYRHHSVADIGTVQNPAVNCKEVLNKTCDEKAETGELRLGIAGL